MGGPRVTLKLQAALRSLGEECDVMFRSHLGEWPRSERLRMAVAPWRARHAGGGYDIVDAASAEGWLMPRGQVVVARSHGLEHRYYRALLDDARAGLLRKPWTHRLWYPAVRLPQVVRAVRRAAHVIVPNPGDQAYIVDRGWAPRERVTVIPHGVDRERWEAAPPLDAARGAGILFCGWWTTSKGGDYLAQAYARLWDNGVHIPLTLLGVGRAGPGWRETEARVRAAFPAATQAWLRIVPRQEEESAVFAEYARHDVLVCPSTSEGFGLVVIEALSQRLPVVCTREVGAAHLLHDGREAVLVPARDAAALAAALAQLLADPARCRAMGVAGHALTAELHWSAIAARTRECYRRALAGSS